MQSLVETIKVFEELCAATLPDSHHCKFHPASSAHHPTLESPFFIIKKTSALMDDSLVNFMGSVIHCFSETTKIERFHSESCTTSPSQPAHPQNDLFAHFQRQHRLKFTDDQSQNTSQSNKTLSQAVERHLRFWYCTTLEQRRCVQPPTLFWLFPA
jgi:hypothetical protein